MDIEQLRYFLAVCDCKQMTKAADSLFLSQSSLSKHIGQLEKEVGVPLFDRSSRTLHITSAGMDFAVFARETVARHDDILRHLQRRHLQTAPLTIGTIPVLAQYNIHQKILAFCRKNPAIELTLLEEKGDHVLKLLDDELVDMAIVRKEFIPNEDYNTIELAADELVLLCPRNHPLAAKAQTELKDLAAEDFLLLDAGHAPSQTVIAACKHAGFTPKIRQSFTRIETIIGFIAANAGIALLPEKDLQAFNTSHICIKKLTTPVSSTLVLTFPHGRHLSPSASVFKDFITK